MKTNMPFIGNDIVDFSKIANKHLNRRFCQKVFNDFEISLIDRSDNPNKVLWLLWAAKETCFKYLKKEIPSLTFAPKLFSISASTNDLSILQNQTATAIFSYKNIQIPVLWNMINDTCCHCVTRISNQEWPHIKTLIKVTKFQKALGTSPSQQLRQLVCNQLSSITNNNYQIERLPINNNGLQELSPPRLISNGFEVPDIDISLSHDGSYLAAYIAYISYIKL